MTTKIDHIVQIGTVPAPDDIYIQVTKGGPYLVHGKPPVQQVIIEKNETGNSGRYAAGKSFESSESMALCRCGHSKHAPFCDGSHLKAPVDLTETASFQPLLAGSKEFDGPTQLLTDNESYCAFSRFCDNGHQVWGEVQMKGEQHERLTEFMVHNCAGGRLLVWDRETQQPIESKETIGIHPIEDPSIGCSGPLMVRGGVRVESADGQSYEIRNRQALCRCGQSSNKPFCDGTHASFKYHDGIA
ncbi:CDGSH iron-sulfur domain-containing protein [Aquirhabdus sp.]|uniref:CDGSH iron-sulfur domain-containing protein n=1 Tax=Aquirhabdus sp. TaxID=2824160 RepID=UPI00396C92B5